jgi:general secretion pathway protein J
MTRQTSEAREARDGGFTLLEIMIAVAILAVMMAIAWGGIVQTIGAKRHYGAQQDRYREARMAMTRIAHDIETAYVSGNEDRTLTETRTFFIGDNGSDIANLRFSSFGHNRLYANANESDQTIIAYYSGPDPVDRTMTDVIRRETRRESSVDRWDAIPGEADPIFTNVKKLKFYYWDVRAADWVETWTTQGTDATAGRMPERVRIELTFVDDNGKDVRLVTQARVMLQEVLQFYAN